MKKLYFLLGFLFLSSQLIEAQTINVTFRVTLKGTGKKLHSGGLRITGGLGSPDQPDWNPGSAKMMTIGTPASDSVYSVTLKVPRPTSDSVLFKFINGNNWGDGANGATEDERGLGAPCAQASGDRNRVLKFKVGVTDTILPVFIFNTCQSPGASEPEQVNITFRATLKGTGKKLHPGGLRVTGGLNSSDQPNWNPGAAKVMTIGTPASDSIYSVTLKVPRPAGDTIFFKFINGDNWGDGANNGPEDERGLSGSCAQASGDKNRVYAIPKTGTNFTLPIYRFNTCTVLAGTKDLTTAKNVAIAPNPTADKTIMSFDNPNNTLHSLDIINIMGQVVQRYPAHNGETFVIERGVLVKGIYFARIQNKEGQSMTKKFVLD
jgi:hypothetical protein